MDSNDSSASDPRALDDEPGVSQKADATGDPLPKSERDSSTRDPEPTGPNVGPGGREIVVPLRLYKTITVFSTLIAVVTFVFGFMLIDAATLQVSLLRTAIATLLSVGGFSLSADLLTAGLALAGVSSIVFGSAVYILGTRFRAQGMGKPQEGSDEG
ncbi:hypothetical protein ACERIT_10645 [Halopenitus sp. H-Gu1]|uniref:DUF7315 family membrane protein n=1 Tax=Halopenitus sp. H-Gu1 TaxID=3242697 RepID=UPI00359CF87F